MSLPGNNYVFQLTSFRDGIFSTGVSSEAYFSSVLQLLKSNNPRYLSSAVLEGIISSAGVGSESGLRASRAALADALNNLDDPALLDVCTDILDIFQGNMANDRIIIPLLEVVAFLFDLGILQRLSSSLFK